tara:strand:- start:3240 stop:3605 length:366 start_codon:yes stop_codon:yes gene_type:complete
MPEYTFNCEECNNIFSTVFKISEYNTKVESLTCPSCNSSKVYRNYQSDAVVTNYIKGLHECTTLGEYADKQSKKYGKEKTNSMLQNQVTKKKEGTGMKELPTGMTRAKEVGLNRNSRRRKK